jgi:hypothetical protein
MLLMHPQASLAMSQIGNAWWDAFRIWRLKRKYLKNPTWRISELYDYATNYGEFNWNTPTGTPSAHGDVLMCEARRRGIIALRRALVERGKDPDTMFEDDE